MLLETQLEAKICQIKMKGSRTETRVLRGQLAENCLQEELVAVVTKVSVLVSVSTTPYWALRVFVPERI